MSSKHICVLSSLNTAMKLPRMCRLGTSTMWPISKSLKTDVKVLRDEELLELRTKYERYKPKSNMVCGLLATYAKWKRERPEMNRLQFFALRDDWKTEGTFVAKVSNRLNRQIIFCQNISSLMRKTEIN